MGKMFVRSGRILNPAELRAEDVEFEDIVTSLSNQCRFAGQTQFFYSVAQHSVHVVQAARLLFPGTGEEFEKFCLLHDYPEAYMQDVIGPHHEYLTPERDEVFASVRNAIGQVLDCPHKETYADMCHVADRLTMAWEILHLIPKHPDRDAYLDYLGDTYGREKYEQIMMEMPSFEALAPEYARIALVNTHANLFGGIPAKTEGAPA